MMVEKAEELEGEADGMRIADRLGMVMAAELTAEMEQLNEIAEPKERWARLKEIGRELYRLRREDHHGRKLRMAEQQWEVRSKREAKEYERREKEAEAKKLLELHSALDDKYLMVSMEGGGAEAYKWKDWEIRVTHGLPMPDWWTNPKTAEEWSKLMMPCWHEQAGKGKVPSSKFQAPSGTDGEQNDEHRMNAAVRVKAGQGKSRRAGNVEPAAPAANGTSNIQRPKHVGSKSRTRTRTNIELRVAERANGTNGTNEAEGAKEIQVNPTKTESLVGTDCSKMRNMPTIGEIGGTAEETVKVEGGTDPKQTQVAESTTCYGDLPTGIQGSESTVSGVKAATDSSH